LDNNLEKQSRDTNTVKKKFFKLLTGNDLFDIIRKRLANDESSIEEYNKIQRALKKN